MVRKYSCHLSTISTQCSHVLQSMSTDEEAKEYLYKVLVIGEASVGKTSIIKRYVHRVFSAVYQATVSILHDLHELRHPVDTPIPHHCGISLDFPNPCSAIYGSGRSRLSHHVLFVFVFVFLFLFLFLLLRKTLNSAVDLPGIIPSTHT